MSKKYFILNLLLLLFSIISSVFLGDFFISTLFIVIIYYCLFYCFYLTVNYIKLKIKKKKFDHYLFIFPLIFLVISFGFFYYVDQTYSVINKEMYLKNDNYFESVYLGNNWTQITIEKNLLRKDFILRKIDHCFYLSSPSYSLNKINKEICK